MVNEAYRLWRAIWPIVAILVVLFWLVGCSVMGADVYASGGYAHLSNPNAGVGSPHPDRNETTFDILGLGGTADWGTTEATLWAGPTRYHVLSPSRFDTEPGALFILMQKFGHE